MSSHPNTTLRLFRRHLQVPVSALLLALFPLWSVQVKGATLYWDNDGTATGNNISGTNLGLSGTWNTSLLNWWDATNPLIAWPNLSADTAIFKGTAGRVTLGSAVTVGTLQFDAANYAINNSAFALTLQSGITANESATLQSGTGGSLTLGANNAWNVANTKTLTVSSLVTDGASSFSIDKQGTGALTLSGANTFDGGVTLTAGTLNIGNASALGTGTLVISGGTLDNTSGAALTLSGNNAQTWGGDFTFTGTSSLNLGTGAVTLGANRQVTVSGSTLTVGGAITDGASSFSLTKAGVGTLVLTGNNDFDGGLVMGAGVLTLSGANTTFGGVTLTAGTLNLNNASALGTGTLVISGGTLDNTSGA
ncbi:MAG: autotransporter-associated beta strand repeat-containing protein, partial [Roseimicrobium sp.]